MQESRQFIDLIISPINSPFIREWFGFQAADDLITSPLAQKEVLKQIKWILIMVLEKQKWNDMRISFLML